jgi:hypothetical protein
MSNGGQGRLMRFSESTNFKRMIFMRMESSRWESHHA